VLSVLFNDRSNQNANAFAGDEVIAPADFVEQAFIQPQFVSTNIGTIGEVGGVPAGTYNLFWDFPFANQRRVGQVALAFAAMESTPTLVATSGAVPEPTAMCLCVAAACGLAACRRKVAR
jgi:hypothetical protein